MSRHIITIPAPCSFVSSNQRLHWAAKHKLMRAWKEAAVWQARRQRIPAFATPVHITATVHRDHNRGRWDVGNLADTAKAAIDGLVIAGVLRDDSNRFVTGPDMRAGDPWADAALVLVLETIEEAS